MCSGGDEAIPPTFHLHRQPVWGREQKREKAVGSWNHMNRLLQSPEQRRLGHAGSQAELLCWCLKIKVRCQVRKRTGNRQCRPEDNRLSVNVRSLCTCWTTELLLTEKLNLSPHSSPSALITFTEVVTCILSPWKPLPLPMYSQVVSVGGWYLKVEAMVL